MMCLSEFNFICISEIYKRCGEMSLFKRIRYSLTIHQGSVKCVGISAKGWNTFNILFSERKIQITRRYLPFLEDLLYHFGDIICSNPPIWFISLFVIFKIMFKIFAKALGIRKSQNNIKTWCQCHCFLFFLICQLFSLYISGLLSTAKPFHSSSNCLLSMRLSGTFSP